MVSLAASEFHEVGLNKLINVTVKDSLCVSGLIACAQVFDQLIGLECIGTDL